MSDYLVNNRMVRGVIGTLRLPMPLPQQLERQDGPWEAKPLEDRHVFVAGNSAMAKKLVKASKAMGAQVWEHGPRKKAPEDARPHALLYDATCIETPADLRDMYAFFHAHVRSMARCGRVVAMTRPPEASDNPACRAARQAVQGFMRSLGKEIGRKGATAQTIIVAEDAEDRAEAVLRFLLSKCAAFVSLQPVHVSAQAAGDLPGKFEQPLAGKTALVTGAARGIGAATARTLAREGARVIVMDRPDDIELAEALAKEIGGSALACDITDEQAAEHILDHVNARYNGLDIVVHNAGITRDKTLGKMSEEQWDLVLAVNLIGWTRTNDALLPHLNDGARILALSSVGGIAGNAGQTNYAATKAGDIGYVQALAPAVAERGITVNAIAPGFIETRMTAAMPFGTREAGRRLSSLSQGGVPEDIAEAVTFLASPDASGITGEVLRVCGGSFLGA
ncbi:MAG: 3-oxoacyl-ACP reductase [Candidatus Hydrogenedentota bacterium]